MNNLKQAFEADLKALKTIEIGIMPARQYYRALCSRLGIIYGVFLGSQLLACLLAMVTNIWDDPWNETPADIRIAKMALGIIFSSAFFTLFMVGKVKNFVLFKQQIKPYLQSGAYVEKKMKQALQLYLAIFTSLSFLCIAAFSQELTLFAGVATFLLSGIIISYVIESEASRIGFTLLVQVILASVRR